MMQNQIKETVEKPLPKVGWFKKISKPFFFPLIIISILILVRFLPSFFMYDEIPLLRILLESTRIILEYAVEVSVVLFAIWLIWGLTPFSRKRAASTASLELALLEGHVNRIFESNEFHRVLKNALPKIDGDEGKIWEMLNSMIAISNQKHETYKKEYKKFFLWTVIIGVVLVTLFLGMSYYFLNEASTGAERYVAELSKDTKQVKDSLDFVKTETVKNEIDKNLGSIPRAYYTATAFNDEQSIRKEIYDRKDQINSLEDIFSFGNFFKEKTAQTLLNPSVSDGFKQQLTDANQNITDTLSKRKDLFETLPKLVTNLNTAAGKAEETFNKSENRVPEVIKRLFITIGVITFFLAILKYCARLYHENFLQAMIAEQDHFLLKKFFMTYKLAALDDDKSKILTAFLTVSNMPNTANDLDKKDDDPNRLMDLMKEFITVLKGK